VSYCVATVIKKQQGNPKACLGVSDSLTDTAKGKNKPGNGRWSKRNIKRRKRYKEGLSS